MSETYKTDEAAAREVREATTKGAGAFEALKEAISGGAKMQTGEPIRMFVSPQEPNSKFLVVGGTMRRFPDPNSPTGFREYGRDGDVWAVFRSGICATRDPVVIEWCEAHAGNPNLHVQYHEVRKDSAHECSTPIGLCRDSSLPGIQTWSELKASQIPTASRPAVVSQSIDIDSFLNAGLQAPNEKFDAESAGSRFAATAAAAAQADKERAAGSKR